ncbi:MAG: HEAT repeat domain-containing protein [Proteobacteria bacterium]|nr:HEAT repeat domain-containing protein [Pseudomonadota bacterium]
MSGVPSAEQVAALLDHRLESVVGSNEISLQRKFGLDALVPSYVGAFGKIRNYPGRMHILFWLQRFARSHPEVVELAESALRDPSRIVRNYACGALAYAGDRKRIPALRELLSHRNEATRADALAAITAIEEQNHHLFADRERTGKVFWILSHEDKA